MFNANDIVTDGITEGIEPRKQRGLEIAARCKITKLADGWAVPSQSSGGRYIVKMGAEPSCTCPDHELRGCRCKHVYAVQYAIERENNADGSTTITETVTISATQRKTYKQDWPAYNAAQTNEKDQFQVLMHSLCHGLADWPSGKGHPRLPLADAVFSAVFKVYSTVSGRRFMSDLRDAHGKGFITTLPHFNSLFNYLENPAIEPILTNMIAESSKPLAAVESQFAVDSTGFMATRFVKWFDQKYGTPQKEHTWVKAHLCCGTKTNVITAVEIRDRYTNDYTMLPPLVNATAQNFNVLEVSADKGYTGTDNHDAIDRIGATPFISFKKNASGKVGGVFEKMFKYFVYNRDEFLQHYHRRSNIESTVMMVKSKFGDSVRSKGEVAMKNEVLAKILCHNVCCLISAFYELGIEPSFWQASLHNKENGCTTNALN